MSEQKTILLEGIISVKSALEGNNRKVEKIYIDSDKKKTRDRKITSFLSYLKGKDVDFELMSREKIDKICRDNMAGNTHGGVVAFAEKRTYTDLAEMLSCANKGDYFVYLDGIEDPYNFGYSIRTMYALGATGFIVPEKCRFDSSGILAKASAGASEMCKMAVAGDDEMTAKLIKEKGIKIVCSAVSSDSESLFDFEPKEPFVLFIGGEKRGISKEFMENADGVIHIPYARENVRFSLPAVSVCSLYAGALYKYTLQKNCF